MQDIEPHFNWRDKYTAEHDERSPFYGRTYNEFAYDKMSYNYYIHPQWDEIESESLFVKLIFADYEDQYAVIELFGEWNDAIDNDIMLLRRELIDPMVEEGISKLILIGDNLLNFHACEVDYYEELSANIEDSDGWIVGLNFRPHIVEEMSTIDIPHYIQLRTPYDEVNWRNKKPEQLFKTIEALFNQWLDDGMLNLSD